MLTIADVAVVVSDAKKSAQWWVDKVGFRTMTLGGSGHAVMVAPPGDRYVLHLCEGKPEPGNQGIAFVTDEIEANVERMQKAGVQFSKPLHKTQWGSMQAHFLDPDGNEFWLLGAPTQMVRDTTQMIAPK